MNAAAERPAKVGLALSGGGFRASFFHIGVLARLAELDLLRRVSVLSCVSGGSIVGALYYVKLKKLLEAKPDGEITREDYLALVRELEEEFSRGVRTNPRARVFLNPAKNLLMLASRRYSRSDRIGDIYDLTLYKPAWGERPQRTRVSFPVPRILLRWLRIDRQVALRELLVQPAGEAKAFHPRRNDEREAKVPVLLLNATSLNTGHAWRFEAVRMGEPPPVSEDASATVADIDKNLRLLPGYFDGADGRAPITRQQRDFPLGLAVAASACVPALFHPLSISGLYDGFVVQLVDGGVHDNQGVEALLDNDCTVLVISDASGQMADKPNPRPWIMQTLLRASSIYGDRVREEQLYRASAAGAAAHGAIVVHLRKGLVPPSARPLDDAGNPIPEPVEPPPAVTSDEFGVHQEVQDALASIRTDLDAFSDVEAQSLMLDGYRMTAHGFAQPRAQRLLGSPPASENPSAWAFGAAAALAAAPTPAYLRQLRVGRERFGKPLHLLLRTPPAGPLRTAVSLLAHLLAAAIVLATAGALVLAGLQLWEWRPGWLEWIPGAVAGAAGVVALAALLPCVLSGLWIATSNGYRRLARFAPDQVPGAVGQTVR